MDSEEDLPASRSVNDPSSRSIIVWRGAAEVALLRLAPGATEAASVALAAWLRNSGPLWLLSSAAR